MEELIIARAAFQIGNQFIGGLTYLYSLVFFALYAHASVTGNIKFSRLEIVTLCYFIISMGASITNSSIEPIIAQYNKLFLCLIMLKIAEDTKCILRSKVYSANICITVTISIYILICLANESAYSYEWGSRTFLMSFGSQHETASLIVLLISVLGSDLVGAKHRNMLVNSCELVLMALLIYPLLMTGARTITACGIIIFLLYLLRLSKYINDKARPFLIGGAFLIAGLIVVPALTDTVFFEKNRNLADASFSNGRDEIWSYYWNLFMEQNSFEQVFGSGVGLIAERSMLTIGTHNDILTFLLSYGVIGLILYVVFVVNHLFNRQNLIMFAVLTGCFVVTALFDGFCGYTELVASMVLVKISFVNGDYMVKNDVPNHLRFNHMECK